MTVPVLLVGSADINELMQLQAFDLNQLTGRSRSVLSLTLSATSGAPGQTVQLTIMKMSAESMGAGGFAIVSQSGQTQTFSGLAPRQPTTDGRFWGPCALATS